jgi:hypothetical protein
MPFFGLVRPKCELCGYRCGEMFHQGWRHDDYPLLVFGKKKCLVEYVRKNLKIKRKTASQGKYSKIWRNVLPTISEILGNPESSGNIALNSEDFALVGNRKSYSFNLEFEDGVVNNNISGSAVARHLAGVLTRSSIIKPVLNKGYFKFKMDKDFILWISK